MAHGTVDRRGTHCSVLAAGEVQRGTSTGSTGFGMWRSSEQSHWVEPFKLQPVPLPELQDTVRSAGPRKNAALLLRPQCVSGPGSHLALWAPSCWPSPLLQAWVSHPDKVQLVFRSSSLDRHLVPLLRPWAHPDPSCTAGRRKLQVSLSGLGRDG